MKRSKVSYRQIASLPVSVKNRNDYADYDYLHKLNDKELEWLMSFHQEFVQGSFKPDRKRVHKTKKLRLDCYARNNSRNRDVYATLKVRHMLFSFVDEWKSAAGVSRNHLWEDAAVARL